MRGWLIHVHHVRVIGDSWNKWILMVNRACCLCISIWCVHPWHDKWDIHEKKNIQRKIGQDIWVVIQNVAAAVFETKAIIYHESVSQTIPVWRQGSTLGLLSLTFSSVGRSNGLLHAGHVSSACRDCNRITYDHQSSDMNFPYSFFPKAKKQFWNKESGSNTYYVLRWLRWWLSKNSVTQIYSISPYWNNWLSHDANLRN